MHWVKRTNYLPTHRKRHTTLPDMLLWMSRWEPRTILFMISGQLDGTELCIILPTKGNWRFFWRTSISSVDITSYITTQNISLEKKRTVGCLSIHCMSRRCFSPSTHIIACWKTTSWLANRWTTRSTTARRHVTCLWTRWPNGKGFLRPWRPFSPHYFKDKKSLRASSLL